jgi:hypothetical protein
MSMDDGSPTLIPALRKLSGDSNGMPAIKTTTYQFSDGDEEMNLNGTSD